jgi:hypothetical protein
VSPLYGPQIQSMGFPAPSGKYQQPSNYLGTSTAGLISGTVSFVPLDAGPNFKSYDTLLCNNTVAQVAGTTVTTLALYADNGTGGLPNLVGGPLFSGTTTLTATGNHSVSLAMNNLRGRYWMAFLYTASVAPTTAATMTVVGNASPALYLDSGVAIGTSGRALQATGQAAMPTTQIALTTAGGSSAPVLAARAL